MDPNDSSVGAKPVKPARGKKPTYSPEEVASRQAAAVDCILPIVKKSHPGLYDQVAHSLRNSNVGSCHAFTSFTGYTRFRSWYEMTTKNDRPSLKALLLVLAAHAFLPSGPQDLFSRMLEERGLMEWVLRELEVDTTATTPSKSTEAQRFWQQDSPKSAPTILNPSSPVKKQTSDTSWVSGHAQPFAAGPRPSVPSYTSAKRSADLCQAAIIRHKKYRKPDSDGKERVVLREASTQADEAIYDRWIMQLAAEKLEPMQAKFDQSLQEQTQALKEQNKALHSIIKNTIRETVSDELAQRRDEIPLRGQSSRALQNEMSAVSTPVAALEQPAAKRLFQAGNREVYITERMDNLPLRRAIAGDMGVGWRGMPFRNTMAQQRIQRRAMEEHFMDEP